MKRGQLEGIEHRPFQNIPDGAIIPNSRFNECCSLSSSEKYYDKLAELDIELSISILTSLRDAAFMTDIRERFQSEECFKISLLRESEARRVLDSVGVKFGGGSELVDSFYASIHLDGAGAPHLFEFNFDPRGGVPRRMHCIVGLNGVGKTQVMARLAMLLSRFSSRAVKENRSTLQIEGSIDPVPSIYTVIAVSFSAFDEFERPNLAQGEEFKYSYCGLQGRGGKLKNKEDLLDDIFSTISGDLPDEKILLLKKSLRELVQVENIDDFVDEPIRNKNLYERLSAGQRLALNCVCHIVSKIEPRTLILFDEPELHLHPQLVTQLLSALSEILEAQDSFAIVATHSPLVVQQLPKECVHVIRRDQLIPMVLRPTFQTFGENLSEITRFIFSASESERDYRHVLDQLIEAAGGDVDAVKTLFDGELSLNADIYLESRRDY